MKFTEPGPLGCEWSDIFETREWTYKGRQYRVLKIKVKKINYVTVDLETGEIKDFPPKPEVVQLKLL